MGFIYKITSPTNREYIGKTYDFKMRMKAHKSFAKNTKKKIILSNSIKKYGWENHKLEIIEEVADELMDEREIFWIKELGTYCYENKMGLNMTRGGEGQRSTWKHDTERIKRASKYFTENNPFKGRIHTEETKRIIGDKAYKRNKETGRTVPTFGARKGLLVSSCSVIAYDRNGLFIGDYTSQNEAAKHFGICEWSIQMIIKGKQKHYKEMVFRKKEGDVFPLIINVSDISFKHSNDKRPVLIVSDSNEIIKEYETIGEAAKETNVPKNQVDRASAGFYKKTNKRNGYNFIYKDLYLSQLKTA